ncbi:hypothetical protein ACOSQ3_023961 [Xanthoceras sorbifolium]
MDGVFVFSAQPQPLCMEEEVEQPPDSASGSKSSRSKNEDEVDGLRKQAEDSFKSSFWTDRKVAEEGVKQADKKDEPYSP